MSFGVECWNASNEKTIDISSRMAKFFGVASIGWSHTNTTRTGTITDSRFTSIQGGTPFAVVVSGGFNVNGGGALFSISGDTLTWAFPIESPADSSTRPNTTFAYGVL
jgi:hypothetical protein